MGGGACFVRAIGVAPAAPGFIRAALTPGGAVANPDLFDTIYTYAWFVTFALSFVVYLTLMTLGESSSRDRVEQRA